MLVEQAADKRGVALHVSCEVDSVATVRDLVAAGIGATVLPYGAIQDLVHSGRLQAVRIAQPRISRTLYIASAGQGARSNAAHAVDGIIRRAAEERIRSGGGFWRAP